MVSDINRFIKLMDSAMTADQLITSVLLFNPPNFNIGLINNDNQVYSFTINDRITTSSGIRLIQYDIVICFRASNRFTRLWYAVIKPRDSEMPIEAIVDVYYSGRRLVAVKEFIVDSFNNEIKVITDRNIFTLPIPGK